MQASYTLESYMTQQKPLVMFGRGVDEQTICSAGEDSSQESSHVVWT